MKSVSFYLILLLHFLLLKICLAQTDSSYINTEEFLEDILQEPEEDQDNSDLYEIIEQLLLNPIDLNSSGIAELQLIPGIDTESASLIYNHRLKYGNYFSVDELNAVKGLDKALIKILKPFLRVTKKTDITHKEEMTESSKDIFSNSKLFLRSRISNDLQTRAGFTNNSFEGSKLKTYNRVILKYDNAIQLGLLFEKDPGENGINEFSSYHLAMKNFGIIEHAVLGDYLIEFGQGLVLWSPYGFSKGSDAIYPVKRRSGRIIPYTSATENNFLRGTGGIVKIDNFSAGAFYSQNKFDANIDSVTGNIISRPVDGYHRTTGELSRRKSAEEKLFGSILRYNTENFNAGILHYQSKLSNNLIPSDVFDPEGNSFSFTSFTYDFIYKNLNIFGEISYNGTSVASVNSFSFFLGRDFTFVSSVRSYPRNFVSFHGFAFGERSGTTSNEFGIYTGIKWKTPIGIVNLYYDQFNFPFATFSNPRPGNGDEFLAEIVSNPFKQLKTKLRYKYEYKDITKHVDKSKILVKRLKQLIRMEILYHPLKIIRLKGRIDYSIYNVTAVNESEEGYSYLQDIRYSPNTDLNLYLRIIFFKTGSFNSAIYEYENDLTGVLSNRALFGEGIRWYFVVRYRTLQMLTLSVKYSETYKPGESSLSSGLNEIGGNMDNRLSFQLDVRF